VRNFNNEGEQIMLTAPAATTSGQGLLVGAIFAVAIAPIANGARGICRRRGDMDLAKAPAEAWTEGQKLYWDNVNRRLTTTAAGNTLVGAALQAQAAADVIGRAIITGQVV
jgi:predicted RecA/RadA family phage recombinase